MSAFLSLKYETFTTFSITSNDKGPCMEAINNALADMTRFEEMREMKN